METQLRGRQDQAEEIRAFLGGPGRDSLLVVGGDAGIGKTALLDLIAEEAARNGAQVLGAKALEFEADLPYSTLNQLLIPLLAPLSELANEHREAIEVICGLRVGPVPGLLIAGAAALALLRLNASTEHILLLMVDDSPWMDLLSAMTLTYLGRRLREVPVRILVGARTDEDDVFVRSGFPTVVLPPLSDDDADALLAERFPAMSASVRRRIQRDALGNPLGLLELPAALETSNNHRVPAVLPLGNRLRALFENRLTALPEQTREMLLFVVLGGGENAVAFEKAIPNGAARTAFPPAEQSGLVVYDARSGRWEFRHPLVRSAVFELSTAEERRRVHAALAEAFADDPERQAWHLGQATTGQSEEIAALLENVSQRLLEIGDGTRATAAILRAAELTPSTSEHDRRLSRAAYLGSLVAGTIGDSPGLLAEAFRNPERSPHLATVIAVAYNLLNGEGDVSTAQRLLLAALAARVSRDSAQGLDSGQNPIAADLIEALYSLVLIGFFGGVGEFWRTVMAHVPDTGALPDALQFEIDVFVDVARATGPALDRYHDAIDRLRFTADPLYIVRFATAGAYVDALGDMREALWRVVEDGRRGEAITPAIQALFLLANDDYFAGRWDELDGITQEGLDLAVDHGYALTTAPARFLRAMVDAARGEEERAHAAAEEILIWAAPRRLVALATYASHIRCMTALPAGRFAEAFTHAATISPPGVFPPYIPHAIWSAFDLIEAAARTGRRVQAQMHLRAFEGTDVAGYSPRLRALVLAAHGLLEEGPSWREHYEAALAMIGSGRWPFDRARILLLFGEQLRREKERTAAKAMLTEAREVFLGIGAGAWARRADRELAALGAHETRTTALTPQETAVANLAATGLSNKEIAESLFLSPRTVSTHLSRAFAKLGISSRAGMRDALTGLGGELRH
ncbi:hypothetical protein AL755_09585 [Arthrobacter sp. ERGS1:01]|uniref:LuxR C-terminal-related transcriptional regulator n=1 Tax=Arthrobacter sp. ERGS1:01 TaxID=1704044 RepID=UPI0006CB2A4F|nr:LuxR family transcriptional regulator [Arthrobacter sp. ERGS1:01]ALE05673.1 hypothetical protein AL755_09585 [Arthrobacter sp. ERGS1:01]